MYERNQFSKEVIVKKVLGMAMVVTLGLSLWLVGPYALGEKTSLTPITNVQQVSTASEKNHHAPPLLEKKALTPFTEGKPTKGKYLLPNLPDFTYAAKIAIPAVVHIKACQDAKIVKQQTINPLDQLFREFFGENFVFPREYQKPPQEASGSGVIYASNGYIITNNHVIEGADHIEVTLNDNRSYKAKLIGADPVTDLAILKIEACNLSTLIVGNSHKLEVGEWVLAVGNPFNLHSTVTKGIVSAKSRDLGNRDNQKLSIQSFIQTDAVINPGNSGGALVNVYGELVGINTAIYASRSASFMGYGFAIPSSLVKKVADDLIQYGAVQRVLLGLTISDVNAELAKKLGLKRASGVYIHAIQEDSHYVKLLQKEDVITQINGRQINKITELQEVIGCAQPGDEITITLYRRGKEKTILIMLIKAPNIPEIVQKNDTLQVEGATFQDIDTKTKKKFKLSAGVLAREVTKGKFQTAGLKKDYILLSFDKRPVNSIIELAEMIRHTTGAVLLGVMEPNKGSVGYLAVDFGGNDMGYTQK